MSRIETPPPDAPVTMGKASRSAPPVVRSLEEVHRSVPISTTGSWLRRLFSFAGPAYMISVGYMDPGNWATDIEGGARFGYRLLWVLLMSNLMAVLLQTLSARLGLVTGRDLAQACRDNYGSKVRWVLFILCEVAIAACDLAEVLGTAIGLNLLFDLPLKWGVIITGFDVFLLLLIQRLGIRKMEGFILMLVSTIGLCFVLEIFLTGPSWSGVATGLIPSTLSPEMLFVAIGILGATVMPHNLYLHSALVQSRDVGATKEGLKQACKFNFIDTVVALNAAFFVNAAILIVAAAAFFSRGIEVTEIQQAHGLLGHVLGSKVAPAAFAVALICAGQSSTLTGTLAGQITMEGFLRLRIRPWLRRLITRSLAIIPAVIVITLSGEEGTYKLLILSQVILSLQLPFAVVPLVKFTSSRRKMGDFVSPVIVRILAWLVATIIISLNVRLVVGQIGEWIGAAGPWSWLVWSVVVPLAAGLGAILVYLVFKSERVEPEGPEATAQAVMASAETLRTKHKRIGVAVDATASDAPMVAEAMALARGYGAELVLMHVVEGVGGQWYGAGAADRESRDDHAYLKALAERLRAELKDHGVGRIHVVLGYGNVSRELIRMAEAESVDFLVVGGHGHRGLADLVHGDTISSVRHGLKIPVLAIRKLPEKSE